MTVLCHLVRTGIAIALSAAAVFSQDSIETVGESVVEVDADFFAVESIVSFGGALLVADLGTSKLVRIGVGWLSPRLLRSEGAGAG